MKGHGGEPERLSERLAAEIQWSTVGDTLYFAVPTDNLWSVSVENGVEKRLTDLSGRRGTLGIAIATDGKFLYFTWEEDLGDIWVMDVVTQLGPDGVAFASPE